MQLKTVLPLMIVLMLLSLAACYESPGFTVHEPGDYKGRDDPLLEKQSSQQQQQLLRERFKLVQTDR